MKRMFSLPPLIPLSSSSPAYVQFCEDAQLSVDSSRQWSSLKRPARFSSSTHLKRPLMKARATEYRDNEDDDDDDDDNNDDCDEKSSADEMCLVHVFGYPVLSAMPDSALLLLAQLNRSLRRRCGEHADLLLRILLLRCERSFSYAERTMHDIIEKSRKSATFGWARAAAEQLLVPFYCDVSSANLAATSADADVSASSSASSSSAISFSSLLADTSLLSTAPSSVAEASNEPWVVGISLMLWVLFWRSYTPLERIFESDLKCHISSAHLYVHLASMAARFETLLSQFVRLVETENDHLSGDRTSGLFFCASTNSFSPGSFPGVEAAVRSLFDAPAHISPAFLRKALFFGDFVRPCADECGNSVENECGGGSRGNWTSLYNDTNGANFNVIKRGFRDASVRFQSFVAAFALRSDMYCNSTFLNFFFTNLVIDDNGSRRRGNCGCGGGCAGCGHTNLTTDSGTNLDTDVGTDLVQQNLTSFINRSFGGSAWLRLYSGQSNDQLRELHPFAHAGGSAGFDLMNHHAALYSLLEAHFSRDPDDFWALHCRYPNLNLLFILLKLEMHFDQNPRVLDWLVLNVPPCTLAAHLCTYSDEIWPHRMDVTFWLRNTDTTCCAHVELFVQLFAHENWWTERGEDFKESVRRIFSHVPPRCCANSFLQCRRLAGAPIARD